MSESEITYVTSDSDNLSIPSELLRRDSEPDSEPPSDSNSDDIIDIPPEALRRASDSEQTEYSIGEDYCWRFLKKVNGKTYLTERKAKRRAEHLQQAFKRDDVTCENIKQLRKKFVIVYQDYAGRKGRATLYYID